MSGDPIFVVAIPGRGGDVPIPLSVGRQSSWISPAAVPGLLDRIQAALDPMRVAELQFRWMNSTGTIEPAMRRVSVTLPPIA